MKPPLLELERLSVCYPDFRLGPLCLSLFAGERVALVGANGAGKSTALAAMAGRVIRHEGRVLWRGEPMDSLLPEVRSRIGFLPETFRGFGWMTVEEHLRFLSTFYPSWDRDYEVRLVSRLGVPRGSRVGTLSKGTKVKLSFVAAEAYRPPVLLLDEPTSGIDPVMRGELLDLLDGCVARGGERLLVFSSHILEDVTRICDRIVLLGDGRLLEDSTRDRLQARSRIGSLGDVVHSMLSGREGEAGRCGDPGVQGAELPGRDDRC